MLSMVAHTVTTESSSEPSKEIKGSENFTGSDSTPVEEERTSNPAKDVSISNEIGQNQPLLSHKPLISALPQDIKECPLETAADQVISSSSNDKLKETKSELQSSSLAETEGNTSSIVTEKSPPPKGSASVRSTLSLKSSHKM